jgi:hypothetical protein
MNILNNALFSSLLFFPISFQIFSLDTFILKRSRLAGPI